MDKIKNVVAVNQFNFYSCLIKYQIFLKNFLLTLQNKDKEKNLSKLFFKEFYLNNITILVIKIKISIGGTIGKIVRSGVFCADFFFFFRYIR